MQIKSLACPNCGVSIPDKVFRGKLFNCVNCGSSLVWPEIQTSVVLNFGSFLCPSCGADNERTRKFCRKCGVSLMKKCLKCETQFYVGDNFCPNGHNYESSCLEKARIVLQTAYANYEKGGDYEKILKICNLAIKIAPGWAEAYCLRAIVCEDLGRYNTAATAYRKSVQLDPTYQDALDGLADIERKKSKLRFKR